MTQTSCSDPVEPHDPQSLVRVDPVEGLEVALAALGLPGPVPVLVLVGGASSLDPEVSGRLLEVFEALSPWLDRFGVTLVDGGTAYGVMSLMGRARLNTRARFPLLGVAAAGTVTSPGDPNRGAALDPNHTHFILVPGSDWGDESPWIGAAARAMAEGLPSLTLVAGGGDVTRLDVINGLLDGRLLVAIAGSGGLADGLARWRRHWEPVPGLELSQAELQRIEVLDLDDAASALPALLLRTLGI